MKCDSAASFPRFTSFVLVLPLFAGRDSLVYRNCVGEPPDNV